MRASAQPQQHPRLVSDSERPGAGVGAILRGARLARDEELREVASALRIRLPYLEAIEDGRVEDLPGVTYGIGFVRAYAEYLGLDSADIVSRFKLEARGIDRRTQLHFPEPLPGNRVPGGALLLLVLVMAGAVYGGWLYTSSQNMTFTEAVEALPERFLALLEDGEPVTVATDANQADSAQAATASPETAAPETADMAPATDPAEPNLAQLPPPATAVDTTAPTQTPEPAAAGEATAPDSEAAGAAPVASQPDTDQAVPAPAAAETVPAPERAAPEIAEPVAAADPQPVADQPAEPAVPAADPTGGAAADTAISAPAPASEPAPAAPAASAVETAQSQPAAVPQPDPPAPAPTAPAQTAPAQAAAATPPQPEPAAPPSIVTEELAAPALPAEEDAADAPVTETASSSDAAATAPAAGGARIIIQATNESWIQVVDASGSVLIEKLMLMGEIYRVPNRDGLKLNTGNAGALKLIVNGTLIPPLSTRPEVMRNIDLSPQALTR